MERVEGRFGGAEVDGAGRSVEGDSGEDCRAVMRVFMTQIGFVIRTVAEPAVAPQSMDSRVVSFWEVREARWAARWRKLRVLSYPGEGDQLSSVSGILWDGGRGGGKYTVIVDEIRHRDAEEGAVEAGVETCDSFALDDAADGVVGG